MEQIKPNEAPKDEGIKLRLNGKGELWYKDANDKVVILDESGRAERTRQQSDPTSDAAPGYGKFSKSLAIEEIPDVVEPGTETPPVDSTDAGAPTDAASREAASQFRTHEGPAGRLSSVHRERMQDPAFQEALRRLAEQHAAAGDQGTIEPPPTEPPPERRRYDARNFGVITESDGSGGLRNTGFRHRLPDGSFETNPDGSLKRYTQEEMRSIEATGFLPEPPPAAGGGPDRPPEGGVRIPERDTYLDPNEIFANQQAERLSHARSGNWENRPEQYIGVKVKRIQDILANEAEQGNYGLMLKAINADKGDILLRYRDGTATKDDMDFMTYGAREYSKWSQKAEAINAGLTTADVELFARRNADMDNLNAHLKEGGELAYAKKLTMYMAMTDPAALQAMEYASKDLKRARDTARFKRSDEKRIALSQRLGLDPNDYGAVFNLKNPERRAETEQRLADHVHERAGGFRRAIDWAEKLPIIRKLTPSGFVIPGSSRDSAIRAVMQANKITPTGKSWDSPTSWVLDTVDSSLHTIASHLGELAGNAEVRGMIQRETITNQPSSFEHEKGPKSFTQVQALERQERYTPEGVKTRINRFIQSDPQWGAKSPAEQDRALSSFQKSELRESGGGGFFAWLFSLVFSNTFKKAAKEEMGRDVNIH